MAKYDVIIYLILWVTIKAFHVQYKDKVKGYLVPVYSCSSIHICRLLTLTGYKDEFYYLYCELWCSLRFRENVDVWSLNSFVLSIKWNIKIRYCRNSSKSNKNILESDKTDVPNRHIQNLSFSWHCTGTCVNSDGV